MSSAAERAREFAFVVQPLGVEEGGAGIDGGAGGIAIRDPIQVSFLRMKAIIAST